jgi:L-idonate 5-dehydrogenase
MRALTIHGAGDLRVDERPRTDPGPGEVEVRVTVGGICGSDLHYLHQGGVGNFKLREPMALGHEVAGHVARVGAGVTSVREGDRVAVHPARPCGTCDLCLTGRSNLCPEMRFLGSAMRFPHVQGGFSDYLVISAPQAVPVPDDLPLERAVFAEPLAVGLHAATRAGDLRGRAVLVTGAGPIGLLALLAVRYAGASRIIVTDIVDEPLAVASAAGATDAINVAGREEPLPTVDVAIEMSGSAIGFGTCLETVKRGGRVVTVGLMPPGNQAAPLNLITMREIEVIGSFRYIEEYAGAVRALADGVDVTPLMSGIFPLDRAREAFDLASDRTRATKVQLDLEAS